MLGVVQRGSSTGAYNKSVLIINQFHSNHHHHRRLLLRFTNPTLSYSSSSSSSSVSLSLHNNNNYYYNTKETTIDPKYLACSIPPPPPPPHHVVVVNNNNNNSNKEGVVKRIAVLVSGGVDSSVALRLLHAAGHSCTAFYLKIWFQEDFENFWTECPWEDDLKYAKAVCDQVDIPLEVVHLTDEYWKNVVSYIIEEYRCGRTPNPDVLCNTRIKFGAFMDAISAMEFDYVASGHYAKVVHPSAGMSKPSTLEISKDMVKDQTYFLSHLSQTQLKRLLFPLGCLPKDEVRILAEKLDLPNKVRKDSQGICFLGKIKFSEFVARHIGEMEGILLEAETGDFLGKHQGFWFYTIGQRQGLKLPGGPWYVVQKDVKNNVVFVSRNYFSFDKKRRSFRVGSLKWLSGSPPSSMDQIKCKVRHGPGFYDCRLKTEEIDKGVAVVELSEDDQGLAAGQFAAFYQERICIGSGVILDSIVDDVAFPVCAKALEIAAMEDKSKLQKPVKIKANPEALLKKSSKPKLDNVSEVCLKLNSASIVTTDGTKSESRVRTIFNIPANWLQQLRSWVF